MRVLFLVPYPLGEAASQRFRFEQYFDHLKEAGIQFEVRPFYDLRTWRILYKKGHFIQKFWGFVKGIAKRKLLMWRMGSYDLVFIHREVSPVGPPIFEWWISRVLKKKIIYDFDDAIWFRNVSESNWFISGLKWHSKVGRICKWAHKVLCGNEFLAAFASKYNSNVILNPTTIDTKILHNRLKDQASEKVVVGWTGSSTTLPYLNTVLPLIKQLQEELEFDFYLIADKEPNFKWDALRFKRWSKESEIEDLMNINIGIMPMEDTPWAKGKCGFKILQYMALGIPALASPVGVNSKIITDGVNGFLCSTEGEWKDRLTELINTEELRTRLGKAGRITVQENYSVSANKDSFLGCFA